MKKPDLVFSCRKCGHLLFVSTKERTAIQIGEILEKAECPNCGEEPYKNWTFVRFGNYGEEYGERHDRP